MDAVQILEQPCDEIATELREKSSTKAVRKMRDLKQRKNIVNERRKHRCTFIIILGLIILLFAIYYRCYSNLNCSDFIGNYKKTYTQILQSSCCIRNKDANFFDRIVDYRILHQDKALQRLKSTFNNAKKFNSVALVGPSGVGKSMTARALISIYPWPNNVHSYVWETNVKDEVGKFRMLRLFHSKLSNYRHNLLIIDSLMPCDYEVVEIFNKILTEGMENMQRTIFVIYIFRLNAIKDEHEYMHDFELLQHLPNTTTINFKPFGDEELKSCIWREIEEINVTLDTEDFDDIFSTIDVTSSGCKNVNAKVRAFGKQKSEDDF